jgi:hypothetical protein
MVTAAQRREAVDHLKNRRYSERRACRLVEFSRSAAWYRLKGRGDADLRDRLKVLAERYPRYGYPTLHDMLKIEGRVINRKRTYRIYREEGSRSGPSDVRSSDGLECPCSYRMQSINAGGWISCLTRWPTGDGSGSQRGRRLLTRMRLASRRFLDLRSTSDS